MTKTMKPVTMWAVEVPNDAYGFEIYNLMLEPLLSYQITEAYSHSVELPTGYEYEVVCKASEATRKYANNEIILENDEIVAIIDKLDKSIESVIIRRTKSKQ